MRLLLTCALALTLAAPARAQLVSFNENGITYGHVHLNVRDIEVHRRLYSEIFGGEVVQRGPLTSIKFPGMLVILTQRAPTGGSQGTIMDHFGFKVRDLQTYIDRWRAAGYEVQSEFTGAEGFPNAYLMGPDSVRLELQEDKTQAQDVIGYHIHFFTPEYREVMAWYVDVFGATPFQRGTIATTANVPGMNLSFGTAQNPVAATRGRAIDHIGFELRNLDAFAQQLQARGITFDSPPREVASIGLKIAFLTDPWGTYIELTEGLVDY
jgi:catechol 2,3-dioxygenase-like lactoylglutathione lyase family enzyme